jgi:hypothetical protein
MPVTGLYLNLAMAWPTAETVLIISLIERTTRIPRMADRGAIRCRPLSANSAAARYQSALRAARRLM